MGRAGLLEQLADGTVALGPKGERLVAHHSFYAAFATPEEWRVVGEGRSLGTLPVLRPLERGQPLLFAGRRWRVSGISERRRLLELVPAGEGFVPEFGGAGPAVPGRVRREMLEVYRGAEAP